MRRRCTHPSFGHIEIVVRHISVGLVLRRRSKGIPGLSADSSNGFCVEAGQTFGTLGRHIHLRIVLGAFLEGGKGVLDLGISIKSLPFLASFLDPSASSLALFNLSLMLVVIRIGLLHGAFLAHTLLMGQTLLLLLLGNTGILSGEDGGRDLELRFWERGGIGEGLQCLVYGFLGAASGAGVLRGLW